MSLTEPIDVSKRKRITTGILEREREKGFEMSTADRFRYRTRYFTDSVIIGSKGFVSGIYQEFKGYFSSRHEKRPKAVRGLKGGIFVEEIVWGGIVKWLG